MKYNDDVLSKKVTLKEDEYEQELIRRINELEPEYSKSLKRIFLFRNLFDREPKVLRRKCTEIRQKLLFLQKELDENYKYEGSIYNNISYTIIRLDYLFKRDTYNTFYKIKIEKNPNKRLKLYRKVFVSLNEEYNNLDKNDFKYKKLTKDIIELIRKNIKVEKSKVRKLIQEESVKEKEEYKEVIIEPIVEEKKEYLDISDSNIINNEDIKEVMLSFRNIIRNSSINSSFINYVKIIRSRLINEDALDDNYELINSVIDSIKYRNLTLKKEKKEKEILRLCSNELKDLSNQIFIRNIPVVEVHDYKFDIVFELLRDKKNYSLIKKMVNDYPVIVNVKNDNRSILSYILQLYLSNYMMILNEHRYDYNIDYIKEVYILFSNSNSLYLSYEDKMELDSILDEFIYRVSELDISSKKKNYVLKEAKELYVENIMHNEENYLKNIDKFEYDKNIEDISFLDPNHSKRSIERDLTDEHTFMLNNPYICYSYVEEKGVEKLKIHTADISNIVFENSALDKDIYNCLLENKKINKTVSNYLCFKKDDIVSAFTYEIVFDKDRNVKSFDIYRSRIKVNKDILNFENNKYVYINLRKIVTDYIQKNGDNSLSGLNKIEYIINDILTKQYIKFSRKENIPIIATKERKIPAIDLSTFSIIQKTFGKLSKRDFKKLSKIFESDIQEKYYDDKVNYKEYNDLSLFGTPNYLCLLNQRTLKTLMNSSISIEQYPRIKQNIIDEYENLIKLLNEKVGYKKEEDFDYKKRRNFKTYMQELK